MLSDKGQRLALLRISRVIAYLKYLYHNSKAFTCEGLCRHTEY
jgi:hypothetical protein